LVADLEKGVAWGLAEKAKALRLLGRRPLEMDPAKWATYMEERKNGEALALDELVERQLEAQLDERLTAKRPGMLAIFRGIAAAAIARLEAIAGEHRRREEAGSARQAAMLSFDASNEGERLRRYQFSCSRTLYRSLDTFLKVRRSGAVVESGEDDAPAALIEPAETRVDPGPVPPPADREDPRNKPIEPPVDRESPRDDVTEFPVESRTVLTISGSDEAGECTSDPGRSMGIPPSFEISAGYTDRGPKDLPVGRVHPLDDSRVPQPAEIAERLLPSLRTTIIALTLALAGLAGAATQGHRGWQTEPTQPPVDQANRRNEPTALPRRGAGNSAAESATLPIARPDRGLPVSSRDAPMTSTATAFVPAISGNVTEPSVSNPTHYRYIGRDSLARSTRLPGNPGGISPGFWPRTARSRRRPNAASGLLLIPRLRTPGGTIS
jgi:hypothetical protein